MGKQYDQVKQDVDENESIVVATTVATIPSLETNTEKLQGNNEEKKPKVERRVRVVAPCDLPTGYKLLVKTSNGDVFDVKVPDGGVERGQVFEAEKHRSRPIVGRFSDGIFDCCGEGNFFWVAWCCHGIAWAAIMEKLNLNWLGERHYRSPKKTFTIVTILWFLYLIPYVYSQVYHNLHPVHYEYTKEGGGSVRPVVSPNVLFCHFIIFVVAVYFIVMFVRTRGAVREKYQIPGDCCGDCLLGYFCGCCAALQIFRHMKRSGDRIERFETPAEAEIV